MLGRTFGIEIECHANMSMDQLADVIRQSFQDNMINHTVYVESGYMHDTSQSNFTEWKVKPDSSVYANNPRMSRNYPYNLEIVSPILKGDDGVKALKVVCQAIMDITTASRSCGLHVHIGVGNEGADKLRNMVNSWLFDEKHFFAALPDSRQNNNYCQKIAHRVQPMTSSESSPYGWARRFDLNRKMGMNLHSLQMRNTVEFRLHSGTVEFPKIHSWLKTVALWVDRALNGDMLQEKSFADFIEKMVQPYEVGNTSFEMVEPVTRTRTIERWIHPDAKKQKMPKLNTKAGRIVYLLQNADNGIKRDEIVEELTARFPEWDLSLELKKKFVSGQLTNMKNPRHGFGFNIVKVDRKHYKMLPVGQAAETETARPRQLRRRSGETKRVSREFKRAVDWLASRANQFEGNRNSNWVSV